MQKLGADELIDYAKFDLRKEPARDSERSIDVTLVPIGGTHAEGPERGAAW